MEEEETKLILINYNWYVIQLEQKQKYAAWKAADIRKAIKEGRKPLPGPPGGDKDLSDTSSSGYVRSHNLQLLYMFSFQWPY